MKSILFILLFGFMPSYGQSVDGYHAILYWAPWHNALDSSSDIFKALKSSEDLNKKVRWLRTQTHLNEMIPLKATKRSAPSLENALRSVIEQAYTTDGPAVIDLAIQSHGDTTGLGCHNGLIRSEISHHELKSFLVAIFNNVSTDQELKFRLFLDYCYSGELITLLKESTWPKHIRFEVYTSTDGKGVSYGSTLARAIAATTLLLSTATEPLHPHLDGFNVYFNMFGRFYFATSLSDDHNPIETWSSSTVDNEILKSNLLKIIFSFFQGKNRFVRHLDRTPKDHTIDIVYSGLERVGNTMARQLFWGDPPVHLSPKDRLNYQILQVRHFFDDAPGAKATLTKLLNHLNSEVRQIAIQTLGEYIDDLSEPPFEDAVDLLYKTYWAEVDRKISSSKNIKLILDHLTRLEDRSPRARQIHQDWVQRACETSLVSDKPTRASRGKSL